MAGVVLNLLQVCSAIRLKNHPSTVFFLEIPFKVTFNIIKIILINPLVWGNLFCNIKQIKILCEDNADWSSGIHGLCPKVVGE